MRWLRLACVLGLGFPIALLANYAMHYYGATPVSADYFGRFAERIGPLLGATNGEPPFVGIMSQGFSGDLHWMDYGTAAGGPGLDVSAEVFSLTSLKLKAQTPLAYWRLNEFGAPQALDATRHGRPAAYEEGAAFYLEGPASLLETKLKPEDVPLHKSDHHGLDFLASVRSRRDPVSDVDAGHRASCFGMLADIAARLQRKLSWDPVKEAFVGAADAAALLRRPMRAPWRL